MGREEGVRSIPGQEEGRWRVFLGVGEWVVGRKQEGVMVPAIC